MEKSHPEEITGLLNGFSLLSLQKLQRQAKTEEQLGDCLDEEEDTLCDFFCKDLSFGPTASDGITYSLQPALGSPSQLRNEIFDHKVFMFKNYMSRKNPATGEEWKTRGALIDLLSLPRDQTPKHMLPESSIIRTVIMKYLILMMNTVTLECCFSAVKLLDSPLCSRRTADQTNKIITIYKEGKAVQSCDRSDDSLFDTDLAVVFWYFAQEDGVSEERRLQLPLSELMVGTRPSELRILKSMEEKKKGRVKKALCRKARKERLKNKYEISLSEEDEFDSDSEDDIQ